MKYLSFLVVVLFSTTIYCSNTAKVEIPSVFSDNMVLQQKTDAAFWGKAIPDAVVKINASWGKSVTTKVNKDSSWSTKIKTPKAGGPYEVKVQIGDSIITYKNVLIGEVWVCSGQSNMEMPLEGWPNTPINNSEIEIQNANYPNIRLFSIPRKISDRPEFTTNSDKWAECTPKLAAKFSATAYFFGRKLNKELNVPIGLIFTSWGGTPVEAWTSSKYISQIPEYKTVVENLKQARTEIDILNKWLEQFPVINVNVLEDSVRFKNLSFNDETCSLPNFNDAVWHEMNLPILWEGAEIGEFDGVVWFRKKVQIPASWINTDLVVELGPIDDMDITYVNGKQVGSYESTGFYAQKRIYDIPKELVIDSILTIAVRVVDNGGGGGMWGKKDDMKLHQKNGSEIISLAGNWKFLPVAEFENNSFHVFGVENVAYFNRPKVSISIGPNVPTMLYNGMIAPIVHFGIRGAIWYQGEANVPNGNMYETLFSLMIKNWREDWNEGNFPFYYAQISPYDYGENSKSYIVREAQLKTLSVPKTGMAVTSDIGDVTNIHPANKQDVGDRLALWALAKDYHKKVVYSGPIYKKVEVKGNSMVITFDYADGGLVFKDKNGESNFLISGSDKVFKKADVKVNGKKLILSNAGISAPAAVRYLWSNTEESTLFNKAGLPASCFRTDNWEE